MKERPIESRRNATPHQTDGPRSAEMQTSFSRPVRLNATWPRSPAIAPATPHKDCNRHPAPREMPQMSGQHRARMHLRRRGNGKIGQPGRPPRLPREVGNPPQRPRHDQIHGQIRALYKCTTVCSHAAKRSALRCAPNRPAFAIASSISATVITDKIKAPQLRSIQPANAPCSTNCVAATAESTFVSTKYKPQKSASCRPLW